MELPRAQVLVGPSVRVERAGGAYRVLSSPVPVHRATVRMSRTLHRWRVVVHTAGVLATDHAGLEEALAAAGARVGALYRLDMRGRFTGPQRAAMGMGQCPAHIRCADVESCPIVRPDHSHLCRGAPDHLSVWCPDHRGTGEGPWVT